MFQHLSKGSYIDLAANDYKKFSNTHFFDHCLKWSGICIEANPSFINNIGSFRTCDVIHTCASDKVQNISFIFNGLYGHIGGSQGVQSDEAKHESSVMQCETLTNILDAEKKYNFTYMSLDVEGAELAVVNGIDWNRIHIAVISVELNDDGGAINVLKEKGYLLKAVLTRDAILVHQSEKALLQWIDNWMEKEYKPNKDNKLLKCVDEKEVACRRFHKAR